MIAAYAALGGGDSAEAEDRLRVGARSPDERVSLAAWNALRWWIVQSGQDREVPWVPPSGEGVRDVGVGIATGQQSGLLGALRAACAVYRTRNPELIEAIHPPIIQGLRQLKSALDYRTRVADRRASDELPLLRHWCVWLAWTMTDADKGDDEVLVSWIKAGDNDPLCLVRFTREWYAASQANGDAEGN